jgi:hypothetical protein
MPDDSTKLWPVRTGDRYGYIDSRGQIAITPRFRNAQPFCEGLAAVRENGTYGYIDEAGKYAIPPIYDFCMPFSEGLAVVYKSGEPLCIDRSGRIAIGPHFAQIGAFKEGRAFVRSKGGKMGMTDRSGKLLIDTAYYRIKPFLNDRAIVLKTDEYNSECAIVDRAGNFIVAFGQLDRIEEQGDVWFRVVFKDTNDRGSHYTGFIDYGGDTLMWLQPREHQWIEGGIHDGLVRMNLFRSMRLSSVRSQKKSPAYYEGFMNTSGELVIADTNVESATDFSFNRAFVKRNDRMELIDRRGRRVTERTFDEFYASSVSFSDGLAVIGSDGLFGITDTNGNFILPPAYQLLSPFETLPGCYIFGYIPEDREDYQNYKFGILRLSGDTIVPPVMTYYDRKGFDGELLYCELNGIPAYIDRSGRTVWSGIGPENDSLKVLNIDFMLRGDFVAYSLPGSDARSGGWAVSSNIPKRTESKSDRLQITVDTSETVSDGENACFRVSVINAQQTPVIFSAQDSRLYMTLQALDEDGKWKDIMYLPKSWCGNSYHDIVLPAGYEWNFLTPVSEGARPAKMRLRLDGFEGPHGVKASVVSNEFSGSVNPAQFWRKGNYIPSGIMDPYDE